MSATLRRTALFAGAVAATLGLAAAPAHAAPVTLSEGHVDVVDIAYEDGALGLGLHDETTDTPVERDPAEVTLHVKPEAETTVPSNAAFSFLGSPGDPAWVLPQSNNPELLYAGWGAHEVPSGAFQGDSVRLKLTAVNGPADVSVFDVSAGAPTKRFDSGDGLPDSIDVSAGAHHHTNWAFEAKGDYTLTFQATGTLTDGTTVNSAAVDYHFTVG
ncbi:choice-of-anchor M domain-containing protein [Streptomyces malaysiensis]|uniref:Choice-of-anchor M domain-containing protein n=1 Tax=Streptomyces malaysiensis subsp. samsunensis TaxID=459658 RepID=A0A9X2RYN3_STRMQ|nr:choice-of-anchor M domain-containing protein [Streptomyces samsunensis]MCQ8835781.1 choice-of-anchor M domain-containing protein [Streptomyces samsunensis]